jgi:SAM-dependent methyltransferase
MREFREGMVTDNPWLHVPATDYERHMNSPAVGQRERLHALVGDVLTRTQPRSALLLGCATGNGLEHFDPAVTDRVVGIDLNGEYLRCFEERFPRGRIRLETRCADLDTCAIESSAFDLVHAALVLEDVAWPSVLSRAVDGSRPGGILSVVLQRPSTESPAVTPSPYPSLRALERIFRFVDPDALGARATELGLQCERRRTEPLPSGKAFCVLWFAKPGVIPGT